MLKCKVQARIDCFTINFAPYILHVRKWQFNKKESQCQAALMAAPAFAMVILTINSQAIILNVLHRVVQGIVTNYLSYCMPDILHNCLNRWHFTPLLSKY